MLKTYGNRKISITRELTKTYEDVFFSDLINIQEVLKKRKDLNIPDKLSEIIEEDKITQYKEQKGYKKWLEQRL